MHLRLGIAREGAVMKRKEPPEHMRQSQIQPMSIGQMWNIKTAIMSQQENRRWVIDDVLPVLRAHGGMMAAKELSEALGVAPDIITRAAGCARKYIAACEDADGVVYWRDWGVPVPRGYFPVVVSHATRRRTTG